MLQDRAGIIVLREDLDFYAIPPSAKVEHSEMIEIKRAAGKALLLQDGIFSGLRRSDESGTTEQHLIEMLTAGCDEPLFLTIFISLTATQWLLARSDLGPPGRRAKQGRHLLACTGETPLRCARLE